MIQSTSLLEVFAEMGLLEAVLLHLSSVVSCVAQCRVAHLAGLFGFCVHVTKSRSCLLPLCWAHNEALVLSTLCPVLAALAGCFTGPSPCCCTGGSAAFAHSLVADPGAAARSAAWSTGSFCLQRIHVFCSLRQLEHLIQLQLLPSPVLSWHQLLQLSIDF